MSFRLQAALDYVYDRRRWDSPSRSDWEKNVRAAMQIDQSMQEFPSHLLDDLIDKEAEAVAAAKLQSPNGMLLLTFHGGFLLAGGRILRKMLSDTALVGMMYTAKRFRENNRGALFAALKVLQAGQTLLIAPDGPDGKQSGVLEVLGKRTTAGEGAAFLAHASGCRTGWYCVTRKGDRFVPTIEFGPTQSAESPSPISRGVCTDSMPTRSQKP